MGCIRFGLKYEMARAMTAPTKQAYLQKSNSNGRRIKSNAESVGDSGTDNYRGLTVLRITKLAGRRVKWQSVRPLSTSSGSYGLYSCTTCAEELAKKNSKVCRVQIYLNDNRLVICRGEIGSFSLRVVPYRIIILSREADSKAGSHTTTRTCSR